MDRNDLKNIRAENISPPEWLPNYEDPENYPNIDQMTTLEWAWEFLRRNPMYQNDFNLYDNFILLAKQENRDLAEFAYNEWDNYKIQEGIHPQYTEGVSEIYYAFPFDLIEKFQCHCFCKKYSFLPDPSKSLKDNFPNASMQKNKRGTILSSRCREDDHIIKHTATPDFLYEWLKLELENYCENSFKENRSFRSWVDCSPKELFCSISLDEDINDQIAVIKKTATTYQKYLRKAGLIDKPAHNQGEEYITFLRTWDGLISTKSKPEIAKRLLPQIEPEEDRNYNKAVDGWWMRAKELVYFDYQRLAKAKQ